VKTYDNLNQMITYSNDTNQVNEVETLYSQVGSVNIERLNGAIPFYTMINKYGPIKRNDERCEDGDCYEHI
jgi:hypothetical protein